MNILYSKEERLRAGVVIHDCILVLGRLVKAGKKNKQGIQGHPWLHSKFKGSYVRLCLKNHPFALDLVLLPKSLSLFSWIFLDTRSSISEQEEGLCKDRGTLFIPM